MPWVFEVLRILGIVGLIVALFFLLCLVFYNRRMAWRKKVLERSEAGEVQDAQVVTDLLRSMDVPSPVLAKTNRDGAIREVADALARMNRVRQLSGSQNSLWIATLDNIALSLTTIQETLANTEDVSSKEAIRKIVEATVTFRSAIDTALRLNKKIAL